MLENALFQVKVAVAELCADTVGTIVCDAAMMSLCTLRTSTSTCTFVSVEELPLERIAWIRGASVEPPCVVFDTVGMIRESVAIRNQTGEDESIARNAFTTVCLPDTMPGMKIVAVPGGKSNVPETS